MTLKQKWFCIGFIIRIILACLVFLSASAWAELHEEKTAHLSCCGDIPCVMCYDDYGNEVDCPNGTIYTKANYIECPRPVAAVSTEPGPWRCHEDEYGIIQCEETYIFNNLVDDFEPSLIIDFDFNGPGGWKRGGPLPQFYVYENGEYVLIPIIEVPDMNGDGTIDEQDKWLAKDAIEQYKTTKHHVIKINSMELPCYIKIEIKYID